MATMGARIVRLEDQVQEHSQSFPLLRQDIGHLNQRMVGLDHRMDRMEQRFDRLDDKFDRGFLWLVGLLVGVLATVVTGFIAVMDQLLSR